MFPFGYGPPLMECAVSASEKADNLLESKTFRLILLRQSHVRREGSLAAALAQSMALAVIGTAGAYPSWVLVQDEGRQMVLGAAWAIAQVDPAPDTPLLGRAGGPLMLAIAFCCLFSVASGSLALTMDFLGRRQCRSLAPLFHALTALLIACAAALGSCLLALVRGRSHLEAGNLSTSPGQSLFLAFLACALASTATGLSCMSPAQVQPARSSWDFGQPGVSSFFQSVVANDYANSSDISTTTVSLQEEVVVEVRPSRRESASTLGTRSGKVHWHDSKIQVNLDVAAPMPELALQRQQQLLLPLSEEEPESEPRKSTVQKFWESSCSLMRKVSQRSAREPAEPPAGGEQETGTGHEGQAASACQNSVD